MTNNLVLPLATRGDSAYALAKAGLSTIPIFGGPAVELFQHFFQPPLEKRRTEWMNNVGEMLADLESRGLDLKNLRENEEFVTAVTHATQLALRTHQKAKLAALRAALKNIASGRSPDEIKQHFFFGFVESLTETHLRILKVFQHPEPPEGISMAGLTSVLEHNFPELKGMRDVYLQLWRDLSSRGLVNTDSLNVTMSLAGLREKRTTQLADEFLSFITADD